jgi:alkylation response protein AidB-like acyl-CoA dehydrogenase
VALGALCGDEARADVGTKDWREALGEGAAVGCVAAAPGPSSLTVSGPQSRVRVSGKTPPVAYAPSADVAVVLAAGAVYGVDLRTEGRPPALSAMDRTRELGVLAFDDTPALFLGGEEAAALLVDRAATLASAEMLGAADHVLADTVQYAKDRVQFGKPIGSFQAVKHLCADMAIRTEAALCQVIFAGLIQAEEQEGVDFHTVAAKLVAVDAALKNAASNIQVHGAIGFTAETDAHSFLKRAHLVEQLWGDSRHQRHRMLAAAFPD